MAGSLLGRLARVYVALDALGRRPRDEIEVVETERIHQFFPKNLTGMHRRESATLPGHAASLHTLVVATY